MSSDSGSPALESASSTLPDGWELVPLAECLSLLRSGLSRAQSNDPVGHPVSRIQTLTDEGIAPSRVRYVADLSDREIQNFLLDEGDLLISNINSEPQLGRSAVYEGNPPGLIHGMNLLRAKVKPESLDPHFLNFLFRWYRMQGAFVRLASRAVGQSSINQGKLKALRVVRPPLAEQRAIVHVLRTVQLAREQTAQVIAAARELKQSLMRHLFTFGAVPLHATSAVVLTESAAGTHPHSWSVTDIGSIGQVVTGATPRTAEPANFGGPYPFFTPSEVDGTKYLDASPRSLTDQGLNHARVLPKGSVLVTCIGNIGRVGITAVATSASNQQINAIVPNGEFDPEFVYYLMEWSRLRIAAAARVTTVPIISKGNFSRVAIAVPSKTEQSRIGGSLAALDQKMIAERQHRDALDELADSFLHDLMTARLRVDGLDAQFG
jgi:type I restriction enzyme, S subunit